MTPVVKFPLTPLEIDDQAVGEQMDRRIAGNPADQVLEKGLHIPSLDRPVDVVEVSAQPLLLFDEKDLEALLGKLQRRGHAGHAAADDEAALHDGYGGFPRAIGSTGHWQRPCGRAASPFRWHPPSGACAPRNTGRGYWPSRTETCSAPLPGSSRGTWARACGESRRRRSRGSGRAP